MTSRQRWTLVCTVIGSGAVFLDSTIVNAALKHIGQDLPGTLVGVLEGQASGLRRRCGASWGSYDEGLRDAASAIAVSLVTASTKRSGLKGLMIQALAPAFLARSTLSTRDSVVSMRMGRSG